MACGYGAGGEEEEIISFIIASLKISNTFSIIKKICFHETASR